MSIRSTILWLISLVTAVVLMDLMDTYKDTSRVIMDNILFIACVIYVGGWILDKFLGIFIKILPESKPIKIKKSSNKKQKNNKELTILQFVIAYPILTFSCMILIGLVKRGFQP